MDTVIKFTDLNFSYDDSPVLSNVNLDIAKNQFIAIIGPNGGGKTTFLKLLMGFLPPTSGHIEVLSVKKPEIAYVPQNQRFDKHFPISVLELVLQGRLFNLPWYGTFSSLDYEMALQALEKVGLKDFCHRAFGTLSGGQAQRALIARALVSDPKLLLLDEPTASVDAQAETDIYKILRDLKGSMTILMVTHDLSTAINEVDSVILVQNNVRTMEIDEVCQHFAIGVYHPPLINIPRK